MGLQTRVSTVRGGRKWKEYIIKPLEISRFGDVGWDRMFSSFLVLLAKWVLVMREIGRKRRMKRMKSRRKKKRKKRRKTNRRRKRSRKKRRRRSLTESPCPRFLSVAVNSTPLISLYSLCPTVVLYPLTMLTVLGMWIMHLPPGHEDFTRLIDQTTSSLLVF